MHRPRTVLRDRILHHHRPLHPPSPKIRRPLSTRTSPGSTPVARKVSVSPQRLRTVLQCPSRTRPFLQHPPTCTLSALPPTRTPAMALAQSRAMRSRTSSNTNNNHNSISSVPSLWRAAEHLQCRGSGSPSVGDQARSAGSQQRMKDGRETRWTAKILAWTAMWMQEWMTGLQAGQQIATLPGTAGEGSDHSSSISSRPISFYLLCTP